MSPLGMIGAIALGILVGALSGVVGIGGGVVLVPALVYFYAQSQKAAQGTALATLLPPVALLAVWTYYREGHVNVRLALLLGAGFLVGGYFGGRWAQSMPDLLLRRIFAVMLIAIAVRLFLPK